MAGEDNTNNPQPSENTVTAGQETIAPELAGGFDIAVATGEDAAQQTQSAQQAQTPAEAPQVPQGPMG